MRWLLVALLQLAAAVLSCGGQTLHPQTCPDPKFLSTPLNDEKVQFLDNECEHPCVNRPMSYSSVTLCINPCGATDITVKAEYYVPRRKYVNLSIPNDSASSFSVKLEFSYDETSVSLALHSRKIASTTAIEKDYSKSKNLETWAVTDGKMYLPFRFINNTEQCDPPITTTQTIVNTEGTSTTALLAAITEETPSADDKESQPEVILAENKCAFAASGVICFILVVIIIVAVYRVRKKRSNSKPGKEGHVQNHCPKCTKEATYVDVLGHEKLVNENNMKTKWTSGASDPNRKAVVSHELPEIISAKHEGQKEGVVYYELPDFVSAESEGRVYYDDEGNRV